MAAYSDYYENLMVDGIFRGGCLTTAGAAGSSAIVKGIWTATTAYNAGDIVVPISTMTAAGGKLLRCTTAGTTGSTATLAVPNPGTTLSDGSVTWTAIATIPALNVLYMALFTCTKGARANSTVYSLNDTITLTANDGRAHFYKVTSGGTSAASQSTLYPGAINEVIVDGSATMTEQDNALDAGTAIVEVSGGSYARQAINSTLANWAGTQGATTTTASTGTSGTTSNNGAITFSPAPTANWSPTGGAIAGVALYDSLTTGNLLAWGILTTPKTVNNGDAAPSFVISAYTFQVDN